MNPSQRTSARNRLLDQFIAKGIIRPSERQAVEAEIVRIETTLHSRKAQSRAFSEFIAQLIASR